MPSFPTPQPINLTLELAAGGARFVASERADTVVEVRPRDPAHEPDVRAATRTRVEYVDGDTLLIKTPKQGPLTMFRDTGVVEVEVSLPTGSRLTAKTGMGDLRCDGRYDDCELRTGAGHLRVDRTAGLRASTGMGDVAVSEAAGEVEIHTGTGAVRLGLAEHRATIQNSNGATAVAQARADLLVKSANGDISIDHAYAGVTAKTACGAVRIGEVTRESVHASTAAGDIEIGIREGTAAWLDVRAGSGQVRNLLDAADEPGPAQDTVRVQAHTYHGNIVIRRAAAG